MRIALVISSLGSGGAERVMCDLANYWSDQHEVFLVTLDKEENKPFYSLASNIRLLQLDQMCFEPSSLMRVWNIIKRFKRLRQALKEIQPNVCLSFVDVTNVTVLLATIGLKFPVVVSERSHPAFHVIPALHRKLRQFLYRRAQCVVVQTGAAREYFANMQRVLVVPNAVSTQSQGSISKEVRHIVSVGRLCVSKGFDDLIRAFAFLSASYPNLSLTVYGEGEDRIRLENLIDALGMKERVCLPGATSNVIQQIAKADMFVFPSQYEGFPNALCEAMAVGLPVIASQCSGNTDIVRDGVDGRLFPVGDVHMLESLMLELINDVEQRKRLSKEAAQISNRFSRQRVLALWDDVIKTAGDRR